MILHARFEHRDHQPCLDGTRVEILADLDRWIDDARDSRSVPRIYCITGLAGTGKTTIAFTVAHRCKNRPTPILGASFFCSREDGNRNNPKLVFHSIADQLGRFCPSFGHLVKDAHSADPELKYSSVSNQLEELIVKPLRKVRGEFLPCIIVLDALDECKDDTIDGTTSVILSSLARFIDSLAPLIFLITSRPLPNISESFQGRTLREASKCLKLHEIPLDVVERDIHRYLETNLIDVRDQCKLNEGWPRPEDVQALTEKSCGSFIFAATAVKFIREHSNRAQAQLVRLLDMIVTDASSPHRRLDELYATIFSDATPKITVDPSINLKTILGTIILLQYPLPSADIDKLLKLNQGTCADVIKHLGALLAVSGDGRACWAHPSAPEYLTSSTRCTDPKLRVDPEYHHDLLTNHCLAAMKDLKRDLCDIRDPSKLNNEVTDLQQRKADHIPPFIQYACCSWAYHLSNAQPSDLSLRALTEFCSTSLLHWVEVCSLLGRLRDALLTLDGACHRLSEAGRHASRPLQLLGDCKRLIREFFPAVSSAASHTYNSALPFLPLETALRQKYCKESTSSVLVHAGVGIDWDPCLRVLDGHWDDVEAVAISSNGSSLATGSLDNTVRCWDFVTGMLQQCFKINSDRGICAVVFSPDGTTIASGLGDSTIVLWDVGTGALRSELKGHKSAVRSVAFSPDAAHVVSGSADGTIRIWDIAKDNSRQLTGHSCGGVRSVTYSHNGAYIVSGLTDMSIHIWDATSYDHKVTLGGHSGWVRSVAYSPDGTSMASGSDDTIIRIWKVDTITPTWKVDTNSFNTLQAHTGPVLCIAYSPNGSHIVSASSDHTVRIWKTTGVLLKTLNGHSNKVLSVVFSPDGTQVISGSADRTARIWDATSKFSDTQKKAENTPIRRGSPVPQIAAAEKFAAIRKLEKVTRQLFRLRSSSPPAPEALCAEPSMSPPNHLSSYLLESQQVAITLSPYCIATYRPNDSTLNFWKTSCTQISTIKLSGSPDLLHPHVRFSHRGEYLAIFKLYAIHIYCRSTRSILQPFQGLWDSYISPTFSTIYPQLAFGFNNKIFVLGLDDQRAVQIFDGHSGPVHAISFSPDGTHIASSSEDKTCRLWSMTTGTQLACFRLDVPSEVYFENPRSITARGYGNNQKKFPIPQEICPDGQLPVRDGPLQFGPSKMAKDGWLYSGTPWRRVCWIPVDLRSYQSMWTENGCILWVTRDGKMVYISNACQ